MLRIAICDDESYFSELMRKMIISYMEKKHAVYEIHLFSSGVEFADLGMEMAGYQIVFLDINMEQLDGIETAKRIRLFSEETFIVFVTAYINYTLEGYKVGAVRYLLKDKANLAESLYECMDAILHKMNHAVTTKEIRFYEGSRIVPLNRLLYIESRLHKLSYHIMEKSLHVYTRSGKLDDIEKEYIQYDFLRIHKSYLVNMGYIDSVQRYEVVLRDGTRLAVPKVRYKFVKESFISYTGEI